MTSVHVAETGRTVVAAGHRTNYHDEGDGPPVVLLHGSGPGVSAWSNWGHVIGDLAQDFRVVAPDMAGFGLTEFKADGTYDIKFWVKHLVALLDELGVERATLVGNSFGGGLSLATALMQGDRVERLVLLGTPAGEFPLTEGLRAGWHYEPSRKNMREILSRFPYDTSFVSDELVDSRYRLSARPGAQAAFRSLISRPPEDGSGTVKGASEKALRSIANPAMILHGRDDKVVPAECGATLHRFMEDSELHSFGRCGHWVQDERREEFVALVRRFAAHARPG